MATSSPSFFSPNVISSKSNHSILSPAQGWATSCISAKEFSLQPAWWFCLWSKCLWRDGMTGTERNATVSWLQSNFYKSVIEIWVFSASLAYVGFPGDSVGKESTWNAGDLGLIPSSARSPGEGNGNPLQYSCLESHGQRSLVGYSPRGRKELNTTEHSNLF